MVLRVGRGQRRQVIKEDFDIKLERGIVGGLFTGTILVEWSIMLWLCDCQVEEANKDKEDESLV